MALKPATTLAEIADTCTPDPLANEKLRAFFVETDAARSENNRLREDLVRTFNKDDRPKRILVYGHRGCGKSTELNCFKKQVGDQWFIVDFSIKNYLPLVGVKAEDVLLAMSIALFDKLEGKDTDTGAEVPKINIDQKYLQQIHHFFHELTVTSASSRDMEGKVSTEAGVGDSPLWGLIIKLKAKVSADLTVGSKKEESSVYKMRQRPGDLIIAVNNLLLAIEESLKQAGKKLMLVVEDLDKLQLADAEDIFVRNNLLLSKLNTNIIYTIPIFTFHTDNSDAIRAQFDGEFALPMIKVFNKDGSLGFGYDKVKELILKRVDKSMIDDDALDLLIHSTGGVLRHIFEALQLVSSFATIRDNHIRRKNIRDALNKIRSDLGVSIGWPRDKDGNQKKPDDLYETLFDAAKKQAAGQEYPPKNDPTMHVLLRACALIEYNGERWLGVHPLAWEYLRALGKDPGPSPYER
jgi:hypothetical protein